MSANDPHPRNATAGEKPDQSRDASGRIPEQAKEPRAEQETPVLNTNRLSAKELSDLGWSQVEAFRRSGLVKDIEEAVEYATRAVELTPEGEPDLPRRLTSLGIAHNDRFRRLGKLEDMEKSIECDSRVLALTPDDHPDRALRHSNLGISLGQRFKRLGQLGDLEQSIEHFSRALALTPDGHPDLSAPHANLGVSYGDRFRRLGDIQDLEQSIEHRSCALELTPDGHPDLSARHASLGVSYTDRFRRLGDIRDLEQSIEHRSCALALTPDGHPNLSARHADLGVSYSDRFRRLGDIRDLERSIEHRSRALELTPDGHPDLSARHASLGISYSDRFRRLGDIRDLEQSIEHRSRALALTPDGHPDLSARHADLGVSYDDRFRRLGDISDLEKAIEYFSSALSLTPQGHPDLPHHHFNQALAYFRHYQRTSVQTSLQQSLRHFRNSSQGLTGTPHLKFGYALEWAKLACTHPGLNCIEAYQATIDLLPQFIWLGATTKTRYDDLSKAERLAINAAFAAIRHSNYPLAIEWLEHARCVVWNQSLMLRSPLDQLYACHPELASRLRTVSTQLYDLGDEPGKSEHASSNSLSLEEVGRQRRRLALEYADLLTEARALPGFEDFLQPMKANRLRRAAKFGPIVVINCHADRCDALIITPGQDDFQRLALPGFNMEKARGARSELDESLRAKGLRQRGVKSMLPPGFEDRIVRMLRDLWTHVVQPILELLGYMKKGSTDNLPHITWCPTGALSFLPLHAAGDYSQPGSRVFDYAISSYIPTLTSLFYRKPSTLNHSSRVLAIGQAYTPGHTPLPGTSGELECLKGHVQNKAQYTVLMNHQATTSAVLESMEEHDWVHLACHAHQNVDDPTKSGFFLHDGTLDLASINRRSFENKGLAFLSACQTATGDEKLPDEAIHLASGMLMAGYSSVIATMWSVDDSDAPFVADKVYSELMKDGRLGNGEAGKALHHAVAALREHVGEKEFGRWVPYIHIGA